MGFSSNITKPISRFTGSTSTDFLSAPRRCYAIVLVSISTSKLIFCPSALPPLPILALSRLLSAGATTFIDDGDVYG